jgi:hypothetical protein
MGAPPESSRCAREPTGAAVESGGAAGSRTVRKGSDRRRAGRHVRRRRDEGVRLRPDDRQGARVSSQLPPIYVANCELTGLDPPGALTSCAFRDPVMPFVTPALVSRERSDPFPSDPPPRPGLPRMPGRPHEARVGPASAAFGAPKMQFAPRRSTYIPTLRSPGAGIYRLVVAPDQDHGERRRDRDVGAEDPGVCPGGSGARARTAKKALPTVASL